MLTMAVGTANAGLSNDDVTFNGVASNGFFGPVDLSNQPPNTITDFANGSNSGWTFGDSWNFLVRDNNTSSSSDPVSYAGLTFTLFAANGQNGQPASSKWELTVTDNNPNSAPSIPFTMDFLIHLHGGSNNAFYFFDDRTINASNAGTFQIAFTNKSGKNFPGLSNFDILVRDLRNDNGGGGGSEIPEPASLLLFGAGLLGFGLNRRRKQA